MTAILEATGIGIAVGGRRLVDGVSVSLAAGELLVVVGPNGAGKTTLMKLMTGELKPTAGEIRLDQKRLADLPAWQLAGKRAVMAQATRLAFPFTVVEVVRIGIDSVGRSLPRAERERLIAEALAGADIEPLAARNYQTLSGGEQQRVQFARTFAQLKAGRRNHPRQVMFLDEPVASLDLAHQIALMEAAGALTREQTVQVRSHPVHSAEQLAAMGVTDALWLQLVQQHHERCDGSGYPHGLRGDAILPGARLLAVADSYAAMVTPRANRTGQLPRDALRALFLERSRLYEDALVQLSIKTLTMHPPGTLARLANGALAVVRSRQKHDAPLDLWSLYDSNGMPVMRPQRCDAADPAHGIVGALRVEECRSAALVLKRLWTH